MSFKILGTGSYIPPHTVTNDDLSKMVDTNDEWITKRVGIKTRHIAINETVGDMAAKAAKDALLNSNVDADSIDLIIAATISNDIACPTAAGYVQKEIGAICPAFDINSACSGFIFALETAAAYMKNDSINRVLVVGTEKISRIIDWTDRNTCVIFGDGAGAFVLEKGKNYIASRLYTNAGDDVIKIPSSVLKSPFYTGDEIKPYIYMNGQETFKFAVTRMTEDTEYVINKAGLSVDDINFFVPHQANIRIIQFAAKKLKTDINKFVVNIDKYGNTSAASVPVAFDELNKSGKLKRGDYVVMSAFGGGLSSAACLIKW